jgi:uncharacterized protein YndB with AHSA1/START domain
MIDSIVREITLPVSPEEAWAAITEPAHLEAWFAEEVETLDPVPGGEVAVRFDGEGTRRAVVEEVEDGHRFAFRWSDAGATRVEFTLEEVEEGTRLIVVESGFDALALLTAPTVGPRMEALSTHLSALALA